MSGYVCIAMLEDPPYSIYLAATEEEPEDWCAGLPLSSHLLCYEAFENPKSIAKQCIRELKAEGVEARTYIAFSAKPWEVLRKFLYVRDEAIHEVRESLALRAEEGVNDPEQGSTLVEYSDDISGQGKRYYHHAQQLDLYDENRLALMKRAAEAGYRPAIDQVINSYYMGWGCEENLEEALKWISDNNIQIDGSQLNDFAEMFDLLDPNRLNLLKKAAESGYDPATEQVIMAYENGWGCCEGNLEEVYEWIVENNIKADDDRLYDLAIDHRLHVDAYNHGQVGLKILSRLALSGHSKAMLELAHAYCDGLNVNQDSRQALFWAEKIKKEDLDEYYLRDLGCLYDDIARVYEEGNENTIPDIKKAIKLFRKAAEFEYPPSYLALSYAYASGDGVRKDLNEALYWAAKNKDTGSPFGYAQMARCFIEAGNVRQASTIWRQCFDECDTEKYTQVLHIYAIDVARMGMTPVHTRAQAQKFHKAIQILEDWDKGNQKEHGHRMHSNVIAWLKSNSIPDEEIIHESGLVTDGVQKKSTSQLLSDAESGDHDSRVNLIRSYINESNSRQALLWLNRLKVDVLDHESIFHVATLYRDLSYNYARGLGLSDELPDTAGKLLCKSIDLFGLVANSESPFKSNACLALSEIYGSGDILPKEPALASKWMSLSSS